MCSSLVHRNGPVTLEEKSKIKALASEQKTAKYLHSGDAEPVPLVLVTVVWHRAEERSGYKSRCWLHSMHCRGVDRHSSDQQQCHASYKVQSQQKSLDLKTALIYMFFTRVCKHSTAALQCVCSIPCLNLCLHHFINISHFHSWNCRFERNTMMCSVDSKLTSLISGTMEVKDWLSRLEDLLVVCLIAADWFGVFCKVRSFWYVLYVASGHFYFVMVKYTIICDG